MGDANPLFERERKQKVQQQQHAAIHPSSIAQKISHSPTRRKERPKQRDRQRGRSADVRRAPGGGVARRRWHLVATRRSGRRRVQVDGRRAPRPAPRRTAGGGAPSATPAARRGGGARSSRAIDAETAHPREAASGSSSPWTTAVVRRGLGDAGVDLGAVKRRRISQRTSSVDLMETLADDVRGELR
uniref:Uncharacterized protein n=1 Tax=Oryza glumipatula TaxID=40148 RepID=A0A0E0BK81_9ORYZ